MGTKTKQRSHSAAKQRSRSAPSPASRRAMDLSREAICLNHRNPSLRNSQFANAASVGVPEMTDVILATGPAVEELDPTAVLFETVPVDRLIFQFYRMGADRLRVVNAKRGPGAEIQTARITQSSELSQAEYYTFGFEDDHRYSQITGGLPINRQAACTESARYVCVRSAAQDTHWNPLSDLTPGVVYQTVTDVAGNEFNAAGTLDAYITQGAQYFRGLGIPRDRLELALFGLAQDSVMMDARLRESRLYTESGLARPDAAVVQKFLGIKQVHMISAALGMVEEPVPGEEPEFVDLLPTDLAVLFYRGLPRVTAANHGEAFWAKDFELRGHPRALEPIEEGRRTSTIWAWEDCRVAKFQAPYALAYENTYDASLTP